ncbi:hypothetical protein PVAND_013098 [Polypedilum vanderplanki]|uniref:ENT domain-containing protein n=1 Tax=Polypedilum vanderplanki TaxID=319348 RepID=A0A9J6CQF2_POLVA|nr:hypothetical protein PVAND_013098 [Polypedilum vanderplanki]
MFPSKVDLTKDECRGALRRLELEAYSSVVSTFRAQGNLDSNKQTVLDQLRRFFKISEDRHKAEIRRVANNEKLTTISELINGKSYDLEWVKEGHRSYPLISRAPSCTALHILADHASKVAAIDNTELLTPSETKRERNLDVEISGKQIITDDPTKPLQLATSPAIFGISRKDLKRSIDLVTLHPHTKKKHYHHLKPPPPAQHMKIQHLYQTLNTKRPRKTFTKKSKTKISSKQSPSSSGRMQMQLPYQTSSSDEKHHFDGAELQRHLTSQLMPPPPMKYTQQPLPTSKKEMNLLKMNHQQQSNEPLAHYIPNNRLKSELLSEHHHQQTTPMRARSGRSKSMSVASKSNYNPKYANGAGSRINNSSSSSMDHIPDPQIIFNTTSSTKMEPSIVDPIPLENNDMDLSPAITSPLQLLSTAASCTPKLKVTSPLNHHHLSPPPQQSSSTSHHSHHNIQIQQPQQQSINISAQLPSSSSTTTLSLTQPSTNTLKTVQNRAIKIIPANTKSMIIKPPDISKSSQQIQTQQQQPQQTIISTTPSKFKIQKIQLVMNKSQDGSTTSISPSATIVSGKAGQLVLSGKGITNTYQVGSKTPYTILSSSGAKVGANGPKVIVQTIDRSFAQAQKESDGTNNVGEKIPENQRITENTPIDFLPINSNSTAINVNTTPTTSNFPKVIIQKSTTAHKQIKLKLGPGSIVNSKIIKGPLPGNLKIQRNINTKGFTVLNTSQIVQIQSNTMTNVVAAPTVPSSTIQVSSNISTPIAPVIVSNNNESTKTDWEQELDDANRTKENKDRLTESNGNSSSSGASFPKKPRLDEAQAANQEVVQNNNDNIIIETTEIEPNLIYAENLPQIDAVVTKKMTPEPEFVYISTENDLKQPVTVEKSSSGNLINGEDESTKLNGQFEEIQVEEDVEVEDDRPHNGAEAYENLVKSLEADDYMKEITGEEEEDSQIDENFRLIELDPSMAFSRETEGIFQ